MVYILGVDLASRLIPNHSRSSRNSTSIGICHSPAPVILVHILFIFLFEKRIVAEILFVVFPIFFSAWRFGLHGAETAKSEAHCGKQKRIEGFSGDIVRNRRVDRLVELSLIEVG